MTINYKQNNELPPLAWIAIVGASGSVEVIHGSSVIKTPEFFASGIWDGKCEDGNFDTCNFSCCTGAKRYDNHLVFATPHHTQACIFSIEMGGVIIFSNSAAFLLTYSGRRYNPDYYYYDKDFCSEFLGEAGMKTTPLDQGVMKIYTYCLITVTQDGMVSSEFRKSDFNFSCFEDYHNALKDTIEKLAANSTSTFRKHKYGMMATISKGYDAPTCAAIAKEFGCNEVFTFNRPVHYSGDCGSDIAKILGYEHIYELDANDYKKNKEYLEALNVSSGDTGSMIVIDGEYKYYKDKLLFCGCRGDSIWGIKERPNDSLIYPCETSNENAYELYLRNNTILVMPPYIGADHASQIYEIGISDEMKRWRLGNLYDRPVCRRIVEENGVKREMFGLKKVGAGFCYHFDNMKTIRGKMSEESYKSLKEFSRKLKQNKIKKIKHTCIFYLKNFPFYAGYAMRKFNIKVHWGMPKEHMCNPFSTTYILWGMDITKKVYENALKSMK